MTNRSMILIAGVLILACRGATAATPFAAANGSHATPRPEEKPLATLERARDAGVEHQHFRVRRQRHPAARQRPRIEEERVGRVREA